MPAGGGFGGGGGGGYPGGFGDGGGGGECFIAVRAANMDCPSDTVALITSGCGRVQAGTAGRRSRGSPRSTRSRGRWSGGGD